MALDKLTCATKGTLGQGGFLRMEPHRDSIADAFTCLDLVQEQERSFASLVGFSNSSLGVQQN